MTDWDKRVEEAAIAHEHQFEKSNLSFTAGANFAREELQKHINFATGDGWNLLPRLRDENDALRKENDELRIATPTMEAVHLLSKQNDTLRLQCEAMAEALTVIESNGVGRGIGWTIFQHARIALAEYRRLNMDQNETP